ncbi:hypothetical protein CIK05_11465 [Bdellovibrio sp. qaytius]|nr:hypothetical protein CIK05_11465 [Bdellovibrio sp. qaytius]
MKKCYATFLSLLLIASFSKAESPWDQGVAVPAGGRANIYNYANQDFSTYRDNGKIHAQMYPVTVTGALPPYQPVVNIIEDDSNNPIKVVLNKIVQGISGISSFDQVMENLALHPYPQVSDTGVYQVPYPAGVRPEHRMGLGFIERNGAKGFTFSCAACHSSNLFGKTVLGMTNRFPTANDFFVKAKKLAPAVDLWLFKTTSGATDAEVQMMKELKQNIQRVGAKEPVQLGLDTSLAQVALSLNRRTLDAYATPSNWLELFPRRDAVLDDKPADSKPMVWWNVKYKNRWLSDGSVVSGNPIFTNIIWNEIGRGVDLKVLENWLKDNQKIIDELTTAVFSSEAPKFTDFYPAELIDIDIAKQGEKIFNQTCAKCHGTYIKAWSLPTASSLSHAEQLATTMVIPKVKTPVIDVGTDPYRRQGMKSLEQLNDLSISKANKIVVKEQEGYVPPPLVGIWARWPYFHNNSVPSLCAVLTPAALRPIFYYAGEANNTATDFDPDCNGYPTLDQTPNAWKQPLYYYDTTRKGMSNAGHDEEIFIQDGQEILTASDKKALIKFLQTL